MTDTTEKKALALAKAVAAAGRRMQDYAIMAEENVLRQSIEAHARAIEQLEAEKAARAADREQHEAFRQEVSDAVAKLGCWPDTVDLGRFIIAKPDPLVEAFDVVWPGIDKAMVEALRAAIEKRGGKIVWGEG